MDKCKILIAEDTDFSRLMIEHTFSLTEHETVFVTNGQEAIDRFKADLCFDFVLLDIEMPIKNGVQAMKEISSFAKAKNSICPIIAMTAHRDEAYINGLLKDGFDSYMQKPFDVATFELLAESIAHNTEVGTPQEADSGDVLFDEKILELWSLGDEGFEEQVLTTYLDYAPQFVSDIERFLKNKDWDAVKAIAHKFISQVSFVGVNIGNDLREIEEMASQYNANCNLDELIEEVKKKINLSILEISSRKN